MMTGSVCNEFFFLLKLSSKFLVSSVLFISLHRYDNGNFYPIEAESNFDCIGEKKGLGYTINIPWNQSTAGDSEYVAAFLRVVMPVAYQVRK